jgi:cell division transport system permease protein
MLTSLKRIIRSGWITFKKQAGFTVATIFIMVITIYLITSLFLFQKITKFSISLLQDKVDVSVYFKDTSLEQDILEIKEQIAKIPEVKSVEYVSNEEAKKRLLEKYPELTESLRETQGMLNLASLNIKAGQADQYAAVANFLENAPFKNLIQKTDYYQRKSVIEKIFSITFAINRTGAVLSLILAIIAFLVAFNQVRLAISNSKEEIFIQRLVGASNWFIRGPFLIQGVISGFFAALFTLLIFIPLVYFLSPKMEVFFPGLNLFGYFIGNFFLIFLIQILSGIGVGVISSIIAIRKYLKV